jgi:hypothetical protein
MYNNQRQNSSQFISTSYANGLNSRSRSRSVPEGLAHPNGDIHWNQVNNNTHNYPCGPNNHQYRSQPRPHVQVLEQITTSV